MDKDDLKSLGYPTYAGEMPDKRKPSTNVPDLDVSYIFGAGVVSVTPQDQFSTDLLNHIVDRDLEPDIFSYNFAGFSGKMLIPKQDIINSTINAIPLKSNELKLQYNTVSETWQVTDGGGTNYFFEQKEYTTNFSLLNDNVINQDPLGTGQYVSNQTNITGWYLTKIISANGDEIIFTYKSDGYKSKSVTTKFESHLFELANLGGYDCYHSHLTVGGGNYGHFGASAQKFDNVYLEKIEFQNGRVEFETTAREDVLKYDKGYDGITPTGTVLDPQRLTGITLYDSFNNIIKNVEFNQTYFGSVHHVNDRQLYWRLRLDELTFKNEGLENEKYTFNYNEPTSIPAKNSFNTDFWGYYNGANNDGRPNGYKSGVTGVLAPSLLVSFVDAANNNVTKTYSGANRWADSESAQMCILKEIVYPTGGKRTFEYELNKFDNGIKNAQNDIELVFDTQSGANTITQELYNCAVDYGYGCNPGEQVSMDPEVIEFDISSPTIGTLFSQCYNEEVTCVSHPQSSGSYDYVFDPVLSTVHGDPLFNWINVYDRASNHPVAVLENLGSGDEHKTFFYFSDTDSSGSDDFVSGDSS